MNRIIEADMQGIIVSPIVNRERFCNKGVLVIGLEGMLPSYMNTVGTIHTLDAAAHRKSECFWRIAV